MGDLVLIREVNNGYLYCQTLSSSRGWVSAEMVENIQLAEHAILEICLENAGIPIPSGVSERGELLQFILSSFPRLPSADANSVSSEDLSTMHPQSSSPGGQES